MYARRQVEQRSLLTPPTPPTHTHTHTPTPTHPQSLQVEQFAAPAAAIGYDVLAVDNVQLENGFGACGVW